MSDHLKRNTTLPHTVRRAGRGGLGWLAARPARLLLSMLCAQQKAYLLAVMLAVSSTAFAVTPPNSVISNTATASYSVDASVLSSSGTATVNTAVCSAIGIKVDLMQYIPPSAASQAPASATTRMVRQSAYSTSGLITGPYDLVQDPILSENSVATPLPANLLLAPLNDQQNGQVFSYASNEPIFVRVVSYDANLSATELDTISVHLTVSNGGDQEILLLTETGPASGVFTGVIPSMFEAAGTVTAHDGVITVTAHNQRITAIYNHADCESGDIIANTSSGLIDPFGLVFDSLTGAPVNGAIISMIDMLTNLPATVYCDDQTTILPQPVVTGAATVCDPVMDSGGYRFPQAAAGNYRMLVSTPAGHTFPSAMPSSGLPATIGTPAVTPSILGEPGLTPGASYGGVFTLWGPILRIDMPADPGTASITIEKSAGKSVVGTGEFVPYTLTIRNNSGVITYNGAQVADHLPAGFRYQKGSARLNGLPLADPQISADARTITFAFDITPATTVTVRYVLEVTPAARTGTAENTAVAIGGLTSNTARASVVVREDLFRNKSILVGRVTESNCNAQHDEVAKGVANVRIVMQDGTFVLTDKDGNWHIDNLRPGTQVVQLDTDSLPKDYEAVTCEDNTRFAGRTFSQFVNLRGGTMWRADFQIQKKPPVVLNMTQRLSAQQNGEQADIVLNLTSTAGVAGYSATLLLPDAAKYVAGSAMLNGVTIDDPDNNDGVLIFRSTDRPAHWQDQYSVKLEGVAQHASIQSLVRYTMPGRSAKVLPPARIDLTDNTSVSAETSAQIVVEAVAAKPKVSSKIEDPTRLVEVLPYDEVWLSSVQPGTEWLHPQESFHPNLPVMMVAVKHEPAQKLNLRVNNQDVDLIRIDSVNMNAARTVALTTWRGVEVKEGQNSVELIVSDASGNEISRTLRTIHYAATPDSVEFVAEQSRLVADGKTNPVIAVRFLDKDGVPVRRGISGEFQINSPYRSVDRREGIDREPLAGGVAGKPRFAVGNDGLALIELEPTTQSGEAVLNFQFNNKRKQEVRSWLEAGQRDWILVGFAEGTFGQKTLSGNMQALQAAGTEDQLFDGDRLAFYAKGSIKGEYLLTAAYDTSKQTGNKQLKQAVDPSQYYTLYADASQTGFDAASASKLYVKLERKQFFAMFGDYDTGLTVTELSRYSRSLNGVKSEYKGDKMGYNAFATVTAQAYVKDEIPGNGTSGIYKVSRGNLVVNSDRIRIETRDRFQSHVIVNTLTLKRYLDYDIDYDKGTLTFREPITVRDGNFNPNFIIAEYESADPADEKATFGGRGSFKANAQTEIGATLVHEGTVGATGDLHGVDVTYQPDDKNKLRAEFATTNRDIANYNYSGEAWMGELQHREEQWDGKAYIREQNGNFGVGQQAGSETGTRKIGADGRVKLSDTAQLKGQVYNMVTPASGAEHTTLEGRVDQRISDNLNAYYGARTAQDKTATGDSQSNQLIGGAAYTMPDKKLTLNTKAEISDSTAGSVNAPDRLTLGADYKVTEQTRAFAEQEFARGDKMASNNTRAGLRTQPWSGGEVSASLGNDSSSDAERTYGNLGMVQRWQINEQWQTDFNLDRSQTIHNSATALNVNTPVPFVSPNGDYTTVALGANYRDQVWGGNARIEIRDAAIDTQKNLQFGIQRSLDEGRTMAAGFSSRDAKGAGTTRNTSDLRVSYAHRPNGSQWIWFDRADYITQDEQSAQLSIKGAKLVNNLNANYMHDRRTQIALQYGAKYVLDTIDGSEYKGYTDLIGVEIRRDLKKDWDIGAFVSTMHARNSGVRDFAYGASIGYKVMDNTWLSVGYNVRGMNDRDFSNASYRAQGAYITLRMKIDQDTLGLNKGNKTDHGAASE